MNYFQDYIETVNCTASRQGKIKSCISIINTLESIWSLYWIDMSDIRKGLGLTQYEMSQRYYTSKRTVESWEASGKGKRNITDSQKMLIAYSIFESERDGKNGNTENT